MQQAAGAAWRTQRDGPSTDLRVRLVRLTRKERDRQRPHGKVRKRGAATAATEKTQSRARRRHQRKKPMLATFHRTPSPAGRAALHPRGQRINIHRSAGAVSVSPSSLSRSTWSKYFWKAGSTLSSCETGHWCVKKSRRKARFASKSSLYLTTSVSSDPPLLLFYMISMTM